MDCAVAWSPEYSATSVIRSSVLFILFYLFGLMQQ